MQLNNLLTIFCAAFSLAGCVSDNSLCLNDVRELQKKTDSYKAVARKLVKIRDSNDCRVLYNIFLNEPRDVERRDVCRKVVKELSSMSDEFSKFVADYDKLRIGRSCENMEDVKSEYSDLKLKMYSVRAYLASEDLRSTEKAMESFRISD